MSGIHLGSSLLGGKSDFFLGGGGGGEGGVFGGGGGKGVCMEFIGERGQCGSLLVGGKMFAIRQ